MQRGPVVEAGRSQIGPGPDQQSHGLDGGTASHIREEPVLFHVAGTSQGRVIVEHPTCIVEASVDNGHREMVRWCQCGVGAPFAQQVRDVIEPAPNGVGIRRLPASVCGFDVGTMVQQQCDGVSSAASSGDMQWGFCLVPGLSGQVGSRCETAAQFSVAVRTVLVIEERVQSHGGCLRYRS